jgi:dephospho-CoA kinase
MFVVGLTGGIGSGKTYVASLFAKHGIDIIDADVIAHQLTAHDASTLTPILRHFGQHVQHADGSLNRAVLRELVFKNPNEKKWLEDYLHPLIRQEIQQQCCRATSPYCIAVIPLLAESGAYDFINRICVVDVTVETQITRTMARDHVTREHVELIIAAQASRTDRCSIAHDIINNEADPATLKHQTTTLHQNYKQNTTEP